MNIIDKSKIHDVIKVEPLEDYILSIVFDDGLNKTIDIKPYINIGISADLKDPDFFNKVYLDNGSVTWPNGFDFCSVFLREDT
ncbi:MAG TPA: DUF2442 domain-containing protein [Ignavibacteria bacterium]|nr:DUF2442 domain-containing protein [Ignavibacteria bacterium]HMQ98553.1 DUF2442 domain-containing protein [Ignavibacteria bacterium]